MARKGRIDARLATQVLVLQFAVVAITLVVAFVMFAVLGHQELRQEYGLRALDMARVLAAAPAVRADVTAVDGQPGPLVPSALAAGPLQTVATQVRQRTDMLFVVITNDEGLRLAHPDVAELGKRTSSDPSEALAGREEVEHETGTLGPSVRAKVPIYAPNSQRVVGEVSVGVSTKAVHEQLWSNLRASALLGGVALLLGAVGSVLLARRWRSLTLGLRPTEMAEMVRVQAAVLHGIGEGVVAADADWRTAFVNDKARRLLGIGDARGRPVTDIGLTPRVLAVFRAADPTPTLATVGEHVVVVSARPVERNGRNLGTVLVVRDRTDVESLTRQLDAVQLMSSALRAQRHEFANRLHLLNGLLHSGHTDEAASYVEELLGTGPLGSSVPNMDAVRDPYLQAFLAAKAAAAREAGVTLTIGENTWVSGRLELPVDVTTVLGNLVDNAIDATRSATGAVKEVEIELLQEHSTLHITVADSGSGVDPEFVDRLFVEGTTTKPDSGIPGGRGIGLALSRQLSRALGGELRLSSAGDPAARLCGAEFIARLPGVMIEEEAQWTAQN
ncbi:Spo0B domain-containing protein [Mycobacterium manitobense]|uniref:histidine kinase n=1 Tax=[Mycobacterium] manitobense TaxID=190147 RepID=A0A9X3BP48_9MYCO|nr:ATP-binding protein [[Mycobacterium] manitobense]MCV7172259.1 Spo0B domain-containing protein [[Mycobacterium] manitobense]